MYIAACFFRLLALTYLRSTAPQSIWLHFGSAAHFLSLKPPFKALLGHERVLQDYPAHRHSGLMQHNGPVDSIFSRQIQGTSATQWKHSTTLCNGLEKKNNALHSNIHKSVNMSKHRVKSHHEAYDFVFTSTVLLHQLQ